MIKSEITLLTFLIVFIYFYNKYKINKIIIKKPLCIIDYKSSFNALIVPCNAAYNALYDLMNNCNHS